MTKLISRIAGVAVLTGALTLAGCSAGPTTSSSETDTHRVFVLFPSLADEPYLRAQAGLEQEAANYADLEFTVDAGTGRGTPEELITKIQAAITQEYDVIAVNGGPLSDQLVPVIQTAIDAGIAVVTFDQALPGLKGLSSHIAIDAFTSGQLAGEFWLDAAPGGGEIGVLRCFIGNALTDSVEEGFNATVEGGGFNVVAREDTQCDIAKSRAAVENMLTAHPRLIGVFSDVDFGVLGAIEAVRSSNRDILLTGCCSADAVIEDLTSGSGVVDATTFISFADLGRKVVEVSHAIVSGEKFEANPSVTPELVTHDNAAEYLEKIAGENGK